jgi:hypothetical protein
MHHEIIGRSRFGKSTYLENLVLSLEGGFVFLDPHGQSAEKIADTIDCIYWDAAEGIIGFNPLKDIPPGQRHLAAAQLVYAFKAIWRDSWGPRLEWILYNSLLVLADNNASILDIPRLLTDYDFQTKCLKRASFKDFWLYEFDRWETRQRNEAIGPVLNKIGQFVANPVLSRILRHDSISFSRIMDKGQRLVVNLAKGKLGDEPSHLLGALIVAGFYSAAQGRPFGSPRFDVIADEFQNFATQSFADILSEAGKYGLNLTLCHQYLAQIPEDLLPAVFANVSDITAFNVSAEDAEFLGKEMDIAPELLTELDRFQTRHKGVYHRMATLPPTPGRGRLEAVRRRTRARYARGA